MRLSRLAVLVSALGAGSCAPSPTAAPVAASSEAVTATRGDVELTVVVTGELEAVDSLDLPVPRTDNWNIAIRWLVEDGTEVQKGDKLAEFDNSQILEKIADYELAVIEAGIELTRQRAESAVNIADKQFELETKNIELEKAKLDASVPRELVSRREHQQFKLAASTATVALAAAQDDLDAATRGGKLEAEVKRLAYQKALRKLEASEQQIDALVIRAPRAGVVVVGTHPWEGRKFQVGDNVWPGVAVAKLPKLTKMLVKATLSDVDDGRIEAGMTATCTVDAFPQRPLPGVIKEVSPVAHESGRQKARRFFSVIIELDDSDPEVMRPGMSVKVEVLAGRAEDGIVAPRAGLDLGADPPQARLASGERADIELGLCNAQVCMVTAGLTEGQALRTTEAAP